MVLHKYFYISAVLSTAESSCGVLSFLTMPLLQAKDGTVEIHYKIRFLNGFRGEGKKWVGDVPKDCVMLSIPALTSKSRLPEAVNN